MKNELQALIKDWELRMQLLDQEIEQGSRGLRPFFQAERNALAECLKELKETLEKEVSNVS